MRALRTLGLELAVFAALAWYAAAHWTSGLVAHDPDNRVLACVVIAVAVGFAIALTDVLPGPRGLVLRLGCAIAGLGAGFVAIGLDRHLLAPAHWDELRDGLDRGAAALGTVQWPYDGTEPWATLTLLLAVPLVLGTAAALAFWPGRETRPFALVVLVAMYGMAVTEHQFDAELARGMGLLALIAAWLWLPRMPERGWNTAAVAGGAVFVACLGALPAAARYEDRDPLIDYQSWNPFEARATTRFDWSHSYGPIDWPREGETLMHVRSNERNYWKVATLDHFDGLRWVRSGVGRGNHPLMPAPYNKAWETSFRVTIRELDSDLFPVAGTPLRISDADPEAVLNEDGTMEVSSEPLEEGDTYTVDAYVPEPTPGEMRAAYDGIPVPLLRYTQMFLPSADDFEGAQLATTEAILASPYAPVLRLAQRLAQGQPTTYDVVRAVQRHLRSEYTYDERPPRRDYPLPAFLFRDRVGYCQQFSGAMALMLRMLGIPARVAAGFTPGSYNAQTKEYRVRDLDAHSWVEVWFGTVGWVPFDPTPSIAPADSQSSADAASASGGSADTPETPDRVGELGLGSAEGTGDPGDSDETGGPIDPWMALAAFLIVGAAALAAARVRARLSRRSAADRDPDLATLRRVLARTGGPLPPRLTLRELELRLERTAGPPAARYARMLRERRFGARGGRPPDGAARRDLRRALSRGKGLRARLAALVALPPVSFRRS
jgi:transglutaminase-like putative cysteine protease